MAIPLLIILTNCSQRVDCPKMVYPTLEAVSKIPRVNIVVKGGMMDVNSTKKAFNTIRGLRVSEHYYYTLISNYKRNFNKAENDF